MSAQVSVLKPAVAANWGNDSPEYAQLVAVIAERDALAQEVERLLALIDNAKVAHEISAPTGSPPRAWTEQEKADCKAALRRIVEMEEADNAGKVDHQPAPVVDDAAKHWHDLYRKECRLRQDDAARYGQKIEDLEAAAVVDDAMRELIQKWRKLAEQHGVRTFTGNDHALFANELEAALARAQGVQS